jgi:hypothetical protein
MARIKKRPVSILWRKFHLEDRHLPFICFGTGEITNKTADQDLLRYYLGRSRSMVNRLDLTEDEEKDFCRFKWVVAEVGSDIWTTFNEWKHKTRNAKESQKMLKKLISMNPIKGSYSR